MSSPLTLDVRDLLSPQAYPHPVQSIRLVETHISWVLLTGDLAYKIKKPVNLGFADFSTLERRRHFCEEELRLNRRLAPQLYLRVVPVIQAPSGPRIGGPQVDTSNGDARTGDTLSSDTLSSDTPGEDTPGEDALTADADGMPLEYAVCMRQFDDERLLVRLAATHKLTAPMMDQLAEDVAEFHLTATMSPPEAAFSQSDAAIRPALENFEVLQGLSPQDDFDQLDSLRRWTQTTSEQLRATFQRRGSDGHIRECHGDMHLGNMFLDARSQVVVFDGIEFNAALRWIDVINEIAFVFMDLLDHGCDALAWRFLNRWLQGTGDYDGLVVLRFYTVYRAMVRAKVEALRASQLHASTSADPEIPREAKSYVRLAAQITAPSHPVLVITFGPSGSGKTWGTQDILEQLQMIRLRSDVERKRMAGILPSQHTDSHLPAEHYSAEHTELLYDHLLARAREVVKSGYSVIVDATFLSVDHRMRFAQAATDLGVPFVILKFDAPPNVLMERVTARAAVQNDASDANADVVRRQLKQLDRLTAAEQSRMVVGGCENTVADLRQLLARNGSPKSAKR